MKSCEGDLKYYTRFSKFKSIFKHQYFKPMLKDSGDDKSYEKSNKIWRGFELLILE